MRLPYTPAYIQVCVQNMLRDRCNKMQKNNGKISSQKCSAKDVSQRIVWGLFIVWGVCIVWGIFTLFVLFRLYCYNGMRAKIRPQIENALAIHWATLYSCAKKGYFARWCNGLQYLRPVKNVWRNIYNPSSEMRLRVYCIRRGRIRTRRQLFARADTSRGKFIHILLQIEVHFWRR